MRRVVITLGAALLAVLPATLGFLGNSSFSQRVPVRVPSRAILGVDNGTQIAHIDPADRKVVQRPASNDKGGPHKHVQPGDDKGGPAKSVGPRDGKAGPRKQVEPRDDKGGRRKHIEPRVDRGGLRKHFEPRDDKGGLRKQVELRDSKRETPSTVKTHASARELDVSGSGRDRVGGRVDSGSGKGSGGGSGHS